MIEVVPFEPMHVGGLVNRRETGKTFLGKGAEEFGLRTLKNSGPCGTAMYKGRVMLCAGLKVLWKGVAEAWAYIAEDAPPLLVDEVIRENLEDQGTKLRLHRIQATVRRDFDEGRQFMLHLGFEEEALLYKYGADAQDYILYRRIIDGN
tara:strand:- start:337 stop:783 length:447 start_codon:yes stop_codon:yes gene_type:complete